MKSSFKTLNIAVLLAGVCCLTTARAVSVTGYASIQEAIDKNPGKMIEVPQGDYTISDSLKITADNTQLCGYGRILQSNPEAPIVTVTNAANVQIRNLTLTRSPGKTDCLSDGILATHCENLLLQNLYIPNNCSQPPVIEAEWCNHIRILSCSIDNYMRLAIDDRTKSPDYGFAFYTIDGTGINVIRSKCILIQNNSVVEHTWIPTQEMKDKYKLGKYAKKNAVMGPLTKKSAWDAEYFNAWQQGAGIAVPTPEDDDYAQVLGNYIENAAQGMDVHADHVVIADNIVNNAFIGMKAMHGARNVIILNNQFSKDDLWSINLMPGAGSHPAGLPPHGKGDPAKFNANIDGGSIVAGNIMSDFGYGYSHWIWPASKGPLLFDRGQKMMNPPLSNVIIESNVVYDTGKDGILVDGKAVVQPPRYMNAIYVDTDKPDVKQPLGPQNLHFSNNLLDPGTSGTSDVDLKP